MKKILLLLFAFALSAAPVFAWGSGDCPFSKKGANSESTTEKTEAANSSKEK